MNKVTLHKTMDKLQQDYELKRQEIMKQYCDDNNPYKEGDKFTDHIGSIIIEGIRYSFGENPCCVYYGVELKKDGTPRKSNSKRRAWQINDVKTSDK